MILDYQISQISSMNDQCSTLNKRISVDRAIYFKYQYRGNVSCGDLRVICRIIFFPRCKL